MNTSVPKVSVIIPTYNRARFLPRAIDSVLAQTYTDYEIVIVDDGSTDDTKKVLEAYNGKIRYFYQDNGGSSSARNRGLKEAAGEYIAFLDSDDIWVPEKLAIQVDILDKNKNTGIVHTKMLKFNDQGVQTGFKPEKATGRNFMELIDIAGDIPTSSVLTRRECFDKAGLFDTDLKTIQDFDMWLRIAEHYDVQEYKGKSLAHYFRHSNQNTSSRKNVLMGLVMLNRKIFNNYKHLQGFPIDTYRKRIASHEYWLSKELYVEKKYPQAFEYLLSSISRFPSVGTLFKKKQDEFPKIIFLVLKTYGYFIICFLRMLWSRAHLKIFRPAGCAKSMPKVLFVHEHHDNIAGQELSLFDRLKGLREIGIECTVLLHDKGIFSDYLVKNGYEVVFLKLSRLERKRFFPYLKTIIGIRRLLIDGRFSVIHCSGAYPSQYCVPAARLSGRPCIVHINSTVYTRHHLKKNFVHRSDLILTVSDAVRQKVIAAINVPEDKVMTVYCGVQDSSDQIGSLNSSGLRSRLKIFPGQKVVGQVSSIIPRKGIGHFIKMAHLIKNKNPNVKFLLIGRVYSESYRNQLNGIIKDLDLETDIVFTGFQEEMGRFFDLLDVHVLASEEEGLARVIVHAQMAGKPIVATDVGGHSEAIMHQKTGILVPPGDPRALAETVLELLEDPEKAMKLGEAAKQKASKQFHCGQHAEILKELYLRLCQ